MVHIPPLLLSSTFLEVYQRGTAPEGEQQEGEKLSADQSQLPNLPHRIRETWITTYFEQEIVALLPSLKSLPGDTQPKHHNEDASQSD